MKAVKEYQRMRDFGTTPEPSGERGAGPLPAEGLFVIQKHDATNLHYDFRLELDGTLKSWAVPKGPSLDPAEPHLAVEVEDHPLDYADFEGVIPEGQYGAGAVIIWDRGRWEPVEDPHQGLSRGKLKFRLYGEKLRGGWLLVRTGRAAETSGGKPRKQQWLLRKLEDDAARPEAELDIRLSRPESVLSGRSLEDTAAEPHRVWHSDRAATFTAAASALEGAWAGAAPVFIEPQLAGSAAEPPAGEDWLHEIKLDGYRMQCRIADGRARLLSRRGLDWTANFKAIAIEAPFLPVREAVLDGEVVWLRANGASDFQALQGAVKGQLGKEAPLYYLVFDLLYLDGWDLREVPLVERKRLLESLMESAVGISHLRYSAHQRGQGEAVYAQACSLSLEGILSKRASSTYTSGRGSDWLKVKCTARQELVIVGFTDSESPSHPFRSLLVGYYDAGALTYAGKVGTGFDTATLHELRAAMQPLEREESPLAAGEELVEEESPHWLEPRLVAEVAFTGWTGSGVLRHASFQGLRADKEAAEVVREGPAALPSPVTAEAAPLAASRVTTPKTAASKRAAPSISLSNPDRIFYPEAGITKRELAEYYAAVAPWILPEILGRPLSLLRCPEGVSEECFFQKHWTEGMPEDLLGSAIAAKSGEEESSLAVSSAQGLVELAQLGVLEIHPWGSRFEHLERPDRLVFDLDPDAGISWLRVIDAARDLRDLLRALGLESYPRLTGGKGLHLVVPIAPEIPWERAKPLTRAIGALLAEQAPDLYTLNSRKAQRKGRIFIDYLRNGRGATAIASYSPRARAGAPVAVPVRWDEISPRRPPSHYTLKTVLRRLGALKEDPWGPGGSAPQRLSPEILASLQGEAG